MKTFIKSVLTREDELVISVAAEVLTSHGASESAKALYVILKSAQTQGEESPKRGSLAALQKRIDELTRICDKQTAALNAIEARIKGVFDHHDLVAFRTLSTSVSEDCLRIIEQLNGK